MRPTSQNFLIFLGILIFAFFGPVLQCAETHDRPNILFIYTDDQSHRTVGAYEESFSWVHTPHIDRLAAQGVRFRRAYIGSWCMPSRASILTGHHPHAIESLRNVEPYPASTYDPEKCPFWPATFRQNGYTTAQIGKWHTGHDTGRGRDWDFQIVWNRPGEPQNAAHYYTGQIITFPEGKRKKTTGYSTDEYTQWALEFIRGENGRDPRDGKPWFLWLCYDGVHGPFLPAPRHFYSYAEAEVPLPSNIFPPRPGKPAWQKTFTSFKIDENGTVLAPLQWKPLEAWIRRYHEAVLSLDEAVGSLVDTLEATGQLDNTLIVFTSDQGFAWGQHGLRDKVAPYDASLLAPLIVSWPRRFPPGQVCPAPVSGVDLIPTFFALAGIDLPWKMHGRDLTPLLQDSRSPWPHPALVSFQSVYFGSDTAIAPDDKRPLQWHGVPWYVALIQDNLKFIRYLKPGESDELYDLAKDPEELNNLARTSEYRHHVIRLQDLMTKELLRTGAPFVDSLTNPRP